MIDWNSILSKAAEREREEAPVAAERERELARKRRVENLRHVAIPIEEHVRSMIVHDRVERTPTVEAALRLVAAVRAGFAPRRVLALLGACGRGKTTAGAVAIAELGGAYATLEHLIDLRRGAKKHRADRLELRALLDAMVLVVDELGLEAERIEDRTDARVTFHSVIDSRVRSGITILCSNLLEDELLERFDGRTGDRLSSMEVVTEVGTSFRQRRPWRAALGSPKTGEPMRVPMPVPREIVPSVRADVKLRAERLREYYLATAKPLELRVELGNARAEALAELRAAEAA